MADGVRGETSPTLPNDQALERLYEHASPNPARVGCPPRDVLRALSLRQRPVGDPLYDHLTQCSPCFAEVRALQRSSDRPVGRSGQFSRWASLAAALVLVVGSATWFWFGGSQEATSITADLTNVTVSRSGQAPTDPAPIVLPRARVNLTLLLPAGYEPGNYELSLVDSNDTVHVVATGRAELKDFVTSLTADFDLRRLPTVPYRLGIRAESGTWLYVPVTID